MTASIDLSKVSPSGVGNYAACPQRLVWDSDYPAPYESKPAADYGTLCHWLAMRKLGCDPPELKEQRMLEESARTLFRGSEERMDYAMDSATDKANSELPTLPAGVRWLCEVTVHTPRILPERRSRKGVAGFGGNIDLLASDRSQLWDYKFTRKLPDKVKISYLWQMASYHLLTGVPVAGLLWTLRDGSKAVKYRLDFRAPEAAEFARQVEAGIQAMGHANFRNHAYPVRTDACEDFCNHRGRCFVYKMPALDTPTNYTNPSSGDMELTMALTQMARTTPDGRLC